MLSNFMFHVWLYLIRSKRSGHIEQNLGPKPNSCQSFFYLSLESQQLFGTQLHQIIPIKSLHYH